MTGIHLIANAHIDPVWLWEWEEGAAAALSTFRTAADLCEEFDGFVFNHNEALLYEWIGEYDEDLLRRIKSLVRRGKWHIMGGWYLQPDCNMPSGESMVRQILAGRRYFMDAFGVATRTAVNFDPFGHSRGLVQILAKAGYDSYLICRPAPPECTTLPDEFVWIGYDGSEVLVRRDAGHYPSDFGKAAEKIRAYMKTHRDDSPGIVLWGVGDHGGGPSRLDLERISALQAESSLPVIHSTPEAYFAAVRGRKSAFPVLRESANPWAVGCYTSMIAVKKRHRQLESAYFAAEKMLSIAALSGGFPYPAAELAEARKDLLFSEFHDILPGSSIQPVEEAALRMMDHGLEILSRLRCRAFFKLTENEPPSTDADIIPLFVHNPHPWPVQGMFSCEFFPADQTMGTGWTVPRLSRDGQPVACQLEREASSLNVDWRKNVVFAARLPPCSMNRFDCTLEKVPERPRPHLVPEGGLYTLKRDSLCVSIGEKSGLLEEYSIDGFRYLRPGSCVPLVIEDSDDPWSIKQNAFQNVIGRFTLLDPLQAAELAGVRGVPLEPVHAIEDGEVRTVIEALFGYRGSRLVVRYSIPRQGTEIEIGIRLFWQEKSAMLKLAFGTGLPAAEPWGQTMYGSEKLRTDGAESVSQKWIAVKGNGHALTIVNDCTYGSSFENGEVRLSMVRSAGYSAHPLGGYPLLPRDRFSPRLDQGERLYAFWINGGESAERMRWIEREALEHAESPFALSFFPPGKKGAAPERVTVSGDTIALTALKKAENGNGFIARLFNPAAEETSAVFMLEKRGIFRELTFRPYEIKTVRIDVRRKTIEECPLLEE